MKPILVVPIRAASGGIVAAIGIIVATGVAIGHLRALLEGATVIACAAVFALLVWVLTLAVQNLTAAVSPSYRMRLERRRVEQRAALKSRARVPQAQFTKVGFVCPNCAKVMTVVPNASGSILGQCLQCRSTLLISHPVPDRDSDHTEVVMVEGSALLVTKDVQVLGA